MNLRCNREVYTVSVNNIGSKVYLEANTWRSSGRGRCSMPLTYTLERILSRVQMTNKRGTSLDFENVTSENIQRPLKFPRSKTNDFYSYRINNEWRWEIIWKIPFHPAMITWSKGSCGISQEVQHLSMYEYKFGFLCLSTWLQKSVFVELKLARWENLLSITGGNQPV